MNLKFEGEYKSIKDISWNNIPKFCVITGENGTGKSQLLDIIRAGIIKKWEGIIEKSPHSLPTIIDEAYKIEDLVFLRGEWMLNNISEIGMHTINMQREDLYNKFTSRLKLYKSLNERGAKLYIEKIKKSHNYSQLDKFFDDLILDNQLFQGETIIKRDFLNKVPNDLLIDLRHQATNSSIGRIFYNYRVNLIEAKANGQLEEEFIKENSEKPWIVINQLFSDINLEFKLNNPEEINLRDVYTPSLKNKETNEVINFKDLSSGEKVLVSLVFWLFHSRNRQIFPKILLLDEPDAHLHPSMIKQFVNVVKNVLCDKYGVRVILTTHCPSTVAMSSEESLFLMQKENPRIRKTTKDFALGILTAGIPSFSINYQNRRQVFVESPNDVTFYEKLYRKLQNHLIPEISLTFIPSGESKTDKYGQKVANCGQVINICEILRRAGNKFIWGIIDWDTKNEPNKYPFIKVLGNGQRYAIENYLFDPILVAAIVLREKIIEKSEFGLSEEETYMDLKSFTNDRLQTVSDKIISIIENKINPTNCTEGIEVSYLNKSLISIPKWYLIHQGHELEDKILETFPELGRLKRGKEEQLKLEILDKIIDDLPDLIPIDILETFQFIQKI